MKHVVVEMDSGRDLTYETDLRVRVGTCVEVPAPYWMSEPQWGKVISLESDFEGDLVRIRRIVPQAEVKAERARQRAEKREAERLEKSKPPWGVEKREHGYVVCRDGEAHGSYYKVEGMAWNAANKLNAGRKDAPVRPSFQQRKRVEQERIDRSARERLVERDRIVRETTGLTTPLRNF